MPWARASSLYRHLECPAASSLPQYDSRDGWRPPLLADFEPGITAIRQLTNLERAKQAGWSQTADWGTGMHAAKAGIAPIGSWYHSLMEPHRERLWPSSAGLHEVGVSFDCSTREVDNFIGTEADTNAWKATRSRDCVVGTVDFWAELPSGEPWIDDLKTGKWDPEVVTPQTLFYLMCRMRGAQFSDWSTGRISVTHIPREDDKEGNFVIPNDLEPSRGKDKHYPGSSGGWKQITRDYLLEFEEEIVAAHKRAVRKNPHAIGGPWCEFCPSAQVCPRGQE